MYYTSIHLEREIHVYHITLRIAAVLGMAGPSERKLITTHNPRTADDLCTQSFGTTTLYTATTTTTQRGWCKEAFVSIRAHLQSQ